MTEQSTDFTLNKKLSAGEPNTVRYEITFPTRATYALTPEFDQQLISLIKKQLISKIQLP
jgi:hypothetical protein